MKKSVGTLCDVFVSVTSFIFPDDFMILDYGVDFGVFIILGKPFLSKYRALIDMTMG